MAVLLAMIAVIMVAVPEMMIFMAAMLVVSAMPPRGVSTGIIIIPTKPVPPTPAVVMIIVADGVQ